MWTTALLVIVPTALFVGLVVVSTRYFAPAGRLAALDMEDAGEIFSTVGTGLAVLIAFLIVAAFGHYQDSAGRSRARKPWRSSSSTSWPSYFDEADSDRAAR